jgi:hypothetical protein
MTISSVIYQILGLIYRFTGMYAEMALALQAHSAGEN